MGLFTVIFLAIGIIGWFAKKLNTIERLLLFTSVIFMVNTIQELCLLGLALGGIVLIVQRKNFFSKLKIYKNYNI